MTREEQIEEFIKFHAHKFSVRYGYETIEELMREMAQWCDNNPKNPWISVEERLPEKARGLYKLEEDEQHKMVLFKTANGRSYIGYLDAEEIWRVFSVPYKGAYPIDSVTWSRVTHWMPIHELPKEE